MITAPNVSEGRTIVAERGEMTADYTKDQLGYKFDNSVVGENWRWVSAAVDGIIGAKL